MLQYPLTGFLNCGHDPFKACLVGKTCRVGKTDF
jgi:hypothetical protein